MMDIRRAAALLLALVMIAALTAVSYTHLDVYKRQAYGWVRRFTVECGGLSSGDAAHFLPAA